MSPSLIATPPIRICKENRQAVGVKSSWSPTPPLLHSLAKTLGKQGSDWQHPMCARAHFGSVRNPGGGPDRCLYQCWNSSLVYIGIAVAAPIHTIPPWFCLFGSAQLLCLSYSSGSGLPLHVLRMDFGFSIRGQGKPGPEKVDAPEKRPTGRPRVFGPSSSPKQSLSSGAIPIGVSQASKARPALAPGSHLGWLFSLGAPPMSFPRHVLAVTREEPGSSPSGFLYHGSPHVISASCLPPSGQS